MLKSTVLLRPTERFLLALKNAVLLSDFSAEKHYFAGRRNGNATMSEN